MEAPPPPPPPPLSADQNTVPPPSAAAINNYLPSSSSSSSAGNGDISPGILITVLVLAIAVILSASLYLLLRFLRRRNRTSHSITPSTLLHHHHHHHHLPKSPSEKNPLIDSLPIFPFDALTGSVVSAGDCAVCLSKFEPKDLLRLLPICCHAFHAECIDTWLATNQSCPLCRSPIFLTDAELIGKFENSFSSSTSSSSSLSSSSRSFRVEIGNISRRQPTDANSGEIRRSYSIGGSFDYVLDDAVPEVPIGSFRWPSDFKAEPPVLPVGDHAAAALAAEVGPRGGWLKDYLSHSLSSSRTTSSRSSGRWFFTGSSRRSTTEFAGNRESELDLEASQLSEEIGELFRWLSGV